MKRSNNHTIVAIIPAYDEEATIREVVTRVRKYVTKVIVCDDGSTDRTGDVAEASGAIVVRHNHNMGYGAALATLFSEARKLNAEVAVTLDGDGQHDPVYIPKIVRPILEDHVDIVIGSRFLSPERRRELPAYREAGIRIITRLSNRASYKGITDAQSGLRAYSKNAIREIWPTEHGMGASTEILAQARQASLTIRETPVEVSYHGKMAKRSPMTQSFEVILTTLKIASRQRPQIFYGMPALVTLAVVLGFLIRASLIYSETGTWTETTLVALGATIISTLFLVVCVILWMLVNFIKETHTA